MGRTVFIVDDHAPFRSSARAYLEAAGFDVIGEAGDGMSALDSVQRLRPDIVLLDVLLPDIDGFEVARRIVERDRHPAVVLTSTRDAVDFGRRIERSGAAGFVAKAELSRIGLEAVVGDDARGHR